MTSQNITKKQFPANIIILRTALEFSWRDHYEDLYGNLPILTDKIRSRILRLVGHIKSHNEEVGHHLVMWSPHQGRRSRGKPVMTFVQKLKRDTGLTVEEMDIQMLDSDFWGSIVGRGTLTS